MHTCCDATQLVELNSNGKGGKGGGGVYLVAIGRPKKDQF